LSDGSGLRLGRWQSNPARVLGEFLFMQQLGFEKVRCNEMPMNSC
jgi:hypothetical protein